MNLPPNGLLIQLARIALHLTQDELAEMAGVSIMTVRRLEAGKFPPKIPYIAAIVGVLEAKGIEFIDPTGAKIGGIVIPKIDASDA